MPNDDLKWLVFLLLLFWLVKYFNLVIQKYCFFFSKSPVSFHLNECVKKNWFWLKKRREKNQKNQNPQVACLKKKIGNEIQKETFFWFKNRK